MIGFETARKPGRVELLARSLRARRSGAGGREEAPIEGPHLGPLAVGTKKNLLIALALALWKEGRLDSTSVPQARGRGLDAGDADHEQPMSRALMRSSVAELGVIVKRELEEGERVLIEGRLKPAARQTLKELGLKVTEMTDPEERRYLDMTPFVVCIAGLAMAARYVSIGVDSQVGYVVAGVVFALIYTMRPFLGKLQRPAEH